MQKLKYINDDKSQGKIYNFKFLIKELNKLDLPDYHMEKYNFQSKWNIVLSERGRAKTTTLLLFALLLFKHYNTSSAYIRTIDKMIAPSLLKELFGVINEYHYIEKIFDGKYNYLKYDRKHYYLTVVDETGNEIKEKRCQQAIFHIMSIDKWEHYKSSFNDMNCDFIVWDEFIDKHYNEETFVGIMNIISTIFRNRKSGMITLLANTLDIEHPLFYDLDIHDNIEYLQRGEAVTVQHTIDTTKVNIYLVDKPDTRLQQIRSEVNLLYFNFRNKALNSITGNDTWDVKQWQSTFILKGYKVLYKPNIFLYIDYHGRYIRLELLIYEKLGTLVKVSPATRIYKDSKICTLGDIDKENKIFGVGYNNNYCDTFFRLLKKNKFYYVNNSLGNMLDNYLFECENL